jgi:putative ABC transport system substrate-binding protein
MHRRRFIALVAGAAAAPIASHAQPATKMPRLGVLLYSTPQQDPQARTIQEGLRELGYVDGKNISIEYRFAEGKPERLPDLAADLVRLKPDVLLPIGGDVAPFVAKATRTIPIIFVMSADPLQLGLVATLARPGGNATGFTFLQDELASKRLELLKEVAPRISRVASYRIQIIPTTSCGSRNGPQRQLAWNCSRLKCAVPAISMGHCRP